jgi:hypothetical protein
MAQVRVIVREPGLPKGQIANVPYFMNDMAALNWISMRVKIEENCAKILATSLANIKVGRLFCRIVRLNSLA